MNFDLPGTRMKRKKSQTLQNEEKTKAKSGYAVKLFASGCAILTNFLKIVKTTDSKTDFFFVCSKNA